MLNIKQQLLKNIDSYYVFNTYECSQRALDTIASYLKKENVIIHLKNLCTKTNVFLDFAQKVRQLSSIYNSLLIIEDRADIANIVEADGIYINSDCINYNNAIKLMTNDKLICSDATYGTYCDFVVSDKQYQNKITYIFNDNNASKKAIYINDTKIVCKTPYLDFKYAISPCGNPWHYVKRTNDSKTHDSAVVITTIVKISNEYNFLFLKTKRPPIYCENKAQYCLESPAGLIGDENTKESLIDCIKKELLEETGYVADDIFVELANSSTSAGLTSETITYATAIINNDNRISVPISDNGVILDRIFVPVNNIRNYINSIDKKSVSISSALVCGLFFALNRL